METSLYLVQNQNNESDSGFLSFTCANPSQQPGPPRLKGSITEFAIGLRGAQSVGSVKSTW